ncbi:hypothetical protein JCM17823_16160 [Halorubrum gandharaense]
MNFRSTPTPLIEGGGVEIAMRKPNDDLGWLDTDAARTDAGGREDTPEQKR